MQTIIKGAFVDKTTGVLLNVNDKLEVTKKRFEEINNAGYGVLLEEIKETKKK